MGAHLYILEFYNYFCLFSLMDNLYTTMMAMMKLHNRKVAKEESSPSWFASRRGYFIVFVGTFVVLSCSTGMIDWIFLKLNHLLILIMCNPSKSKTISSKNCKGSGYWIKKCIYFQLYLHLLQAFKADTLINFPSTLQIIIFASNLIKKRSHYSSIS